MAETRLPTAMPYKLWLRTASPVYLHEEDMLRGNLHNDAYSVLKRTGIKRRD